MAYKKVGVRKVHRKKRYGRGRRRFMKYGSKAGSMAYSALKLARKLKDMVNIEYKNVDITDTASVSFTGYVANLNNISQGATDNTRVGDSCKIQNLTFRALLARNGADAQLRCIIFWDKQAKVSSASDILQATGSAYATIAPKNYDKRFQTQILYDHVFNLTTNDNYKSIDLVIPVNQHTQFSGGTNTIDTGYLGVLFISNTHSGSNPTMIYYSRCTFTDD